MRAVNQKLSVQNIRIRRLTRGIVGLCLFIIVGIMVFDTQRGPAVFVSLGLIFLAMVGAILITRNREEYVLNIQVGDKVKSKDMVMSVKLINDHKQVLLEEISSGKLYLVKPSELFYEGFNKQ